MNAVRRMLCRLNQMRSTRVWVCVCVYVPVHGRWWKKIHLVELFNLKHEHWMLNHSIQFAACWAFIISHGSRPQLSEIEHYVSRNYISNRSPHVISIVCCRKSEQLNQKHIDSILYLRYALNFKHRRFHELKRVRKWGFVFESD